MIIPEPLVLLSQIPWTMCTLSAPSTRKWNWHGL